MFAYKVDVSQGGSELVQLHAFKLGYSWEYDQMALRDKNKPGHLKSHYLYFNKQGTIWFGDDKRYFQTEREHMLLSIENFLKL